MNRKKKTQNVFSSEAAERKMKGAKKKIKKK